MGLGGDGEEVGWMNNGYVCSLARVPACANMFLFFSRLDGLVSAVVPTRMAYPLLTKGKNYCGREIGNANTRVVSPKTLENSNTPSTG